MKLKHFALITAIAAISVIGLVGCWYDQDEERHPTDPDRTGVQGWVITMTITPATAPANEDATMQL